MKKLILTSLLFLFFVSGTFAQAIPNGSFENWTTYTSGSYVFETPDGWKTTDSITLAASAGFMHSAVKESAEVHSGNFALKLIGWTALGSPVPGAASNGDIDIGTLSIVKGTPDTVRHAKLLGQYRFEPIGGDTCYIMVAMMKRNSITNQRDTIGFGQFTASTASGGTGYSPFEIILNYNSTEKPDSMLIVLLTSPLRIGSGHVNTVLYVDNLSFNGVVGIDEIETNINSVELYPSPASTQMTIRVDLKKPVALIYSVHDVKGKHVISDVLEPYETSVNVSGLPAGNYTLNLLQGNARVYSTNFMINR